MSGISTGRAFRALADALVVVDRLRLRSWDSQDLTISQLRLMTLLRDHHGLSNAEVARLLNVQPSSVTRIADRLIDRGLIEKHSDPTDGRGVRLTVTPEGVRAARAIHSHARDVLSAVFERMEPAALDAFVHALEALRDAAAAEDVPAAGAGPALQKAERVERQRARIGKNA